MEMGMEFWGDFWTALSQWHPHRMALYAMLTASVVTTALMMRIAGGIPYVVGSVGFVTMYICAFVANFLGKDVSMPSVDDFQRGIALSFCGQLVGALVLLLLFRVKEQGIRRQ